MKLYKITKNINNNNVINYVVNAYKYNASSIKEWNNSIYNYNKNNNAHLNIIDKKVRKLLKSYLNLFTKKWLMLYRRILRIRIFKKIFLKNNQIYLSKLELKHTPSFVFITIYVFYNRNRAIKYLKKRVFKRKKRIFYENRNFLKNLVESIYKKKVNIRIVKLKYPAERFGKSLIKWVKLSNSGDFLKLLVPNYNRDILSGWINHSCTVISQKSMDNHGSKSDYSNESVKEQRIDGSWHKELCLRCILMGFRKRLSNQNPIFEKINFKISDRVIFLIFVLVGLLYFDNKLIIDTLPFFGEGAGLGVINPSLFSVIGVSRSLNPWWITGLVDGEGCFRISILEYKKYKTGFRVEPIFIIALHEKDRALLELISSFWGVGKIYKQGDDSIQYRVSSIKGLEVILNHFDKYPLKTQKLADYLLIKQAYELIKNKEHLTPERKV